MSRTYIEMIGTMEGDGEVEGAMLIAFDSTQQALRAEMLLEYADIEIDLFPTPKEITAGCALSIQFPPDALKDVQEIIRQEHVEVRGIFALDNNERYINIEE